MTDYTELKRLAEAAQYENCEFQHELVAATKAFFVGCIPEQILALIAERDQLKAENEALRERSMSAWRVMAEAAPPYRQRVLVFLPEYGDQVTASLQEPDQFFATDFFEFDDLDCIEAQNVGHWMPLPADPEASHD